MAVRTSLEYARGAEWAPWDQYTVTGYPFALGTGGTITGRFRRWGVTGAVRVVCTFGTSGGGGAGTYDFELPSGWVARTMTNGYQVGHLMLNDTGTAVFDGRCYVASGGSNVIMQVLATSGAYAQWTNVTATVPFTWTSGDFFVAYLPVELAS